MTTTTKTCEVCGRTFATKRSHAQTCSPTCRKALQRKRDSRERGTDTIAGLFLSRKIATDEQRAGILREGTGGYADVRGLLDRRPGGEPPLNLASGMVPTPPSEGSTAGDVLDREIERRDLQRALLAPWTEPRPEWTDPVASEVSALLLRLRGLFGLALSLPCLVNEPDVLDVEPDDLREALEIEEALCEILAAHRPPHGLVEWRQRRRKSPSHRAFRERVRRERVAERIVALPRASVTALLVDDPDRRGEPTVSTMTLEQVEKRLLGTLERQHEEQMTLLLAMFGQTPAEAAERILEEASEDE